jgi:hypothetical protein
MTIYTRPDLSDDEKARLLGVVAAIHQQPLAHQLRIISVLVLENAALTAEVNHHRQQLGYEPMPVYGPHLK